MVEALKTPRRRATSDRTSPPGPLVLRICSTQREGQIIRLKSPKCTIGSGEHCTLRIRAVGVQPLHCILIRKAAQTIVRRWGADTRLNGASFTDAPLHAGDRLSLGPVEFEVLEPGTPSPPLGSPDDSLSTRNSDRVGKGDSLVEHLRAAKDLARKRTGKILERLRQANLQIEQLTGELHENQSLKKDVPLPKEGETGLRDNAGSPPPEQPLLEEAQALLREEQANFEAARQRWRHEHDQSERALKTQQAEFDRQTQELSAAREELQANRQRYEQLTEQLAQERARAQQQSETVTREAADLEHLRQELAATRAELGSMREAVDREHAAAEAERQRCEELAEQLRQERTQAEQQSETATREASDLERQWGELAAARAKLDSTREAIAKEREATVADRQRYEQLTEQLAQERVHFEQQSKTVASETSDLERQREELAAARAEIDSMREAVGKEREAAEADRQRYEQLTEQLRLERLQAEQQSETAAREASDLERQREEIAATRAELDSMREAVDKEREAAEADRHRYAELAEQLRLERAQAEQQSETAAREASDLERQREELAATRAELGSMRQAVAKQREATEAEFKSSEQISTELEEDRDRLKEESARLAQEAAELSAEQEAFAEEQQKWETAQLEAQRQIEQRAGQLDAQKEALDQQRQALAASREDWEALQAEAENKLATRAEQLDARERELDERTAQREMTRYAPNESPGSADSEALSFLDNLQNANADVHSTSSHDLFRQMEGVSPSQTQPRSELTGLRDLQREEDPEEEESPIIMREEPGNVRPSVSEILLADPVIADSFVRPPQEERPDRSQAANAPESNADEDVSIEQYMAGLLARVNHGVPSSASATYSRRAADPRREEAQEPASSPQCQGSPREQVTSEAPPTPEPDARANPTGPRAIAPERAEDLVTLRELANLSAQSALDTHARSRLLKSVHTKLSVVVVALATSAYLFYRWKATPGNSTYYYTGLAVILIAIFWGMQYAMLAGYAYFRNGRESHGRPEPTPPTDAIVEQSSDTNKDDTSNAEAADAPQPPGTESSHHDSP